MVVFRLIGDRWTYADRIGISIKPGESFKVRLSALQQALEIDSFVGWALYRTEGRPPQHVRATVPLDIATNPQREKLTRDGTILYVKEADQDRQAADKSFHKSLQAWRSEKGIKEMRPDGSDVTEFVKELSSRLNVDDSKDISEHESELRDRIEGQEMRAFWVLTFEYREVQNLKDNESEERATMEREWHDKLLECHTAMIMIPLLIEGETRARTTICDDLRGLESEERSLISIRERGERPRPPPVVARAGISEDDMLRLQEDMKSMVETASQAALTAVKDLQMQLAEVLTGLAHDVRKGAAETQELRALIQGRHTTNIEAVASLEKNVSQSLEHQRVSALTMKAEAAIERNNMLLELVYPRNDGTARSIAAHLQDQNDALRRMVEEEAAMMEQHRQALLSHERGVSYGMHNIALNELALQTAFAAIDHAQARIHKELTLANRYFEEFKDLERKKAEEAKRLAEAAVIREASRRKEEASQARARALVRCHSIVGCSLGVFDHVRPLTYDSPTRGRAATTAARLETELLKCESRLPPLPGPVRRAYTFFLRAKTDTPTMQRLLSLSSSCNDVNDKSHSVSEADYYRTSSRDVPLEERDSLLSPEEVFNEDAAHDGDNYHGHLCGRYLDHLLLVFGGSLYYATDALVRFFDVPPHPYRARCAALLERYDRAYLVPALELLLDLFRGHEVELIIAAIPALSHRAARAEQALQWRHKIRQSAYGDATSAPHNAVEASSGWRVVAKGTTEEHYYHTLVADMSQWNRPRALIKQHPAKSAAIA